jgi:hypothetical protein
MERTPAIDHLGIQSTDGIMDFMELVELVFIFILYIIFLLLFLSNENMYILEKATCFPMPIGMAASFDEETVFRVFTIGSDEGRANITHSLKTMKEKISKE